MNKTSERIFNIEEQSWCTGRNFLRSISTSEEGYIVPLVVYVSPFDSNIALEVEYLNGVVEYFEICNEFTFLDELLENLRLWKHNKIVKISFTLLNRNGFSKNLPPINIVVRYRTNEILTVVPDGKVIYR